MSRSRSPLHDHVVKNVLLLLLSITWLPIDISVIALSYAAKFVLRQFHKDDANGQKNLMRPRTILVTGVGMSKGLVLARLFHNAGHRVIGADFSNNSPGRMSCALSAFYTLRKPTNTLGSGQYIQGLLDVIHSENVDLWVSCSGVASATEDGEAKEIIENRTNCRAIQFDVATTQLLHEKHSFIQRTRGLGLTVPETHTIASHETVEEALANAPTGRKYIMKTIGMDDLARGDMSLLPKPTPEETTKHLEKLNISEKRPWILQQFIEGKEYCTHSLVVRGHVKAFVACPSAELLMHYEALPSDSALSRAMLLFTQYYASKSGENFTGHLSFDFLVEDSAPTNIKDIVLYPIECNPRAHTAVILFRDTPAMVGAYLSLLENPRSKDAMEEVVFPHRPRKYYWTGNDLVTLWLLPVGDLLTNPGTMRDMFTDVKELLGGLFRLFCHLLYWKDGTYELQDPLPWLFLYHLYWPQQFWSSLRNGDRWSRINVSTLKIFGS